MDMPLLLPSLLHEIYAILKAKGRGKGFFSEVITVFEEFAGMELSPEKREVPGKR